MEFYFCKSCSYYFLEEIIDKITVLFLLVIFSPKITHVSCLIFFNLVKSFIFTHWRSSLNSSPFRLLKLISMSNESDLKGKLISLDKWLSDFEIFFRSTSLDVKYLKNKSFLLDFKIILKNVWRVFASKYLIPKNHLIMYACFCSNIN